LLQLLEARLGQTLLQAELTLAEYLWAPKKAAAAMELPRKELAKYCSSRELRDKLNRC